MFTNYFGNLLAAGHRYAHIYGARLPSGKEIGQQEPAKPDSTPAGGEKLLYSRCRKQIDIRACGPLYAELKKSKPRLFRSAPDDGAGVPFTVQYYDSVEMAKCPPEEAPVVCILHGSPGHYEDFASLLNFLTIRGFRVVSPNFPDYSATYQNSFRHSARERLDFLLEFFKAIGVNRIDMLIGHSSSVYTMFELLDHSLSKDLSRWATTSKDFRVGVRSLGLFSTPSHKLPPNMAVTTVRLFSLRLFEYPLLRPLSLALIGVLVRVFGIKNRLDAAKVDDLLMAASTMGYSEHERLADRLNLLKQNSIPVLLVYGTRDRLIGVESFEQLERDLGVASPACVKVYQGDGSLKQQTAAAAAGDRSATTNGRHVEEEQQRRRQQLVEVSRFENGGHYVFQRHSSLVNEDVLEFLQNKVLAGGVQATRL
jgi:pimeloyl-ACP methyl ester carboxylesterase